MEENNPLSVREVIAMYKSMFREARMLGQNEKAKEIFHEFYEFAFDRYLKGQEAVAKTREILHRNGDQDITQIFKDFELSAEQLREEEVAILNRLLELGIKLEQEK